jgi:hypothetical protein
MDASGKVTAADSVSIVGTVASVGGGGRRLFAAGQEFGNYGYKKSPVPSAGQDENVRLMGVVRCPPPGALADKIFNEATRFSAKAGKFGAKALP